MNIFKNFIIMCFIMLQTQLFNTVLAEDFQTCANTIGQNYVNARNKILKRTDLNVILGPMLESDDWNNRITATILFSWTQSFEKYKSLSEAEAEDTLNGQKRFLWSSDPENIDISIIPLMFEFLIKDSVGEAGREAAIRIIPYLARRTDIKDLSVIEASLNDERTSIVVRDSIARVLERIPEKLIDTEKFLQILDKEINRKDSNERVLNTLLNSVVSRSYSMSIIQKDEVVAKLLTNRIQLIVGEKPIVFSIGSIGGNKALPIITEFFKNSKNDGERRWAISTIASIGTNESLQTVKIFLNDEIISEKLKLEAISGLGRAKFSEPIGNELKSIFYQGKTLLFQQEALRSLETLMNRTKDTNDKKNIRNIIYETNLDLIKNYNFLKSQLEETKNRIK